MRIDSGSGNVKWGTWYYDSLQDKHLLQGPGIINSIKETSRGKIICALGDDFSSFGTRTNAGGFFGYTATGQMETGNYWYHEAGYNIGGFYVDEMYNGNFLTSGNEAVIMTDSSGVDIWKAKYTYNVDNVGSQIAKVNKAKVLSDGRIMVIGQEYEPDSYTKWKSFYYDAWWAEIAFAYGTISFQDTSGYKGQNDNIVDFIQLASKNLVFVGTKGGLSAYKGVWVLVTDATGKRKLFNKTFFIQDSSISPTQYPISVASSPDSGFTVIGYVNSNGRKAFAAHFIPKAISAVTNITAGYRAGSRLKARVSKTRLMVSIPVGSLETRETDEISIFDMLGKRVAIQTLETPRNTPVSFDISRFPAGTYFVRLQTAKNIQTAKLVIGFNLK